MTAKYPAGPDESLIASGEYHYFCNGDKQNIDEQWTIHRLGKQHIIRSNRIAHNFGVQISTRVTSGTDWLEFKKADVSWNDLKTVTVEVTNDVVLFPLMRIYMGGVIAHLVRSGGSGSIIIPIIKDPDDIAKLLEPEVTTRNAKLLNEDNLVIDGEQHICSLYDYSGDQYEIGSRFWIDEHGVLLKYTWQQDEEKSWNVKLSNYNRC